MVEVRPGWQKVKRTGLVTGQPEFQYLRFHGEAFEELSEVSLRVVADHRGVCISGSGLNLVAPADFESLAWVIGDAGREHLKFKNAMLKKPRLI